MINKKGVLFHWVMFGILLAIGVFLVGTKGYIVQQEPAGIWHWDFISKTLQQSEIDQLELDQNARDAGWEVALLLAKQGGFSEDSGCGQIAGRNIWNDGEKWCLPIVKEVASTLVDAKIIQTKITFTKEMMRGVGENRVIEVSGSKIQRYEYSTNLAIDLDYSFDEYVQLEQEARSLVRICKNSDELEKCINKNKLSYWQFCEERVIGKAGVFCVSSPGNYVIKDRPIVYELGLRFGGENSIS